MVKDMNTPAKGLTLDQAFTQLKASRSESSAPVEELEDENVEVVEEDLDDEDFETEGDELEEDDSEDDDLDEEAEEGEESEESEEDEVFEIEIDGEMVEVTADELHKGYLRHNDYTRKRQADAKRAKELEAEYTGKIEQLNNALAQSISQEERQLATLQQKYKAAPDDATRRGIHYQILQLQQNVQTRQQAAQQAAALQQQTISAQQEAYWNEQEELLRTQYENWDDKKVELKEYLTNQGFQDLSMFAHADMAGIVDKAKQFDELQQKRKAVTSKKIRRKVPKVLKGGQGEKKFNLDRSKIQKLEARFAKTGNIKDAQALLQAKRGR